MNSKSMVVKTLLFSLMVVFGCLSISTMANNNEAMQAGKEFANTLNDSSVKDVAKDMDPTGVPNYQGTDIPETDYYESGVNIENQASAVAADNPTAQFIKDAREKRPNFNLDRETDPLFVRYEEIKNQARGLTDTYSDCAALPIGVENNVSVDKRPTASCKPGSVHTQGNTSCVCERTVVDSEPLTPSCLSDYSFDDEAENCTSSNIETSNPDLVCETGYSLNANVQCEHTEVLSEHARVQCPSNYNYEWASQQCVNHVTDTNQPGLTCAAGYTYVSRRNRCEKQETITVVATPTCPSGYTYDAYHNRCQTSVLETVSATATCSGGQLVNGSCVGSIQNCRTDLRATRECKYGSVSRSTGYQVYFNTQRGKNTYYKFHWWTFKGDVHNNKNQDHDELINDGFLYYPGAQKQGRTTSLSKRFEVCRCALNQSISTTPTNTCPADYSLNSSSGRCEKVGTVYQNPGQTCPSGYNYNSSSNLCEKQNTVTQSPTPVCDSPYRLNQSTQRCEHEQTFTEPPEFVCPVGYSLQGQSCKKTVITTADPEPVCAADETLNATTSVCEKTVIVTATPSYGCQDGYVRNLSTNICEEETFSFNCETTTPARTVDLCGQTLMCLDGNCAEEYQGQEDASQDFLKAATGIAVANEIAEQIDQENLTIFEGDSKKCKKKLAGFSNCCKDGGWGTDLGLDNCNNEEKELGLLKEAQRVQYVGRYCSDDSIFGCLAKSSVYCTYPSKLARIVIQEGKAQLSQGFGAATSPNCAGFSVNELESLNFDAMDLSEFYSDVAARDPSTPDSDDLTNDIQDKLKDRYEGIK